MNVDSAHGTGVAGGAHQASLPATDVEGRLHQNPDLLIRAVDAGDAPAVRALHEQMDEHDAYLRFFGGSPNNLDRLVDLLCRRDDRHVGLGAFVSDTLVGMANYIVPDTVDEDGPAGDCAVVVAHRLQHHGIGTALIRQLTRIARGRGLPRLSAAVLAQNTPMLTVLDELGWSRTPAPAGPIVERTCTPAHARDPDTDELIPAPTGSPDADPARPPESCLPSTTEL